MSIAEVQDPQVQSILENLRSLSSQVKMIDNELGTKKGEQALRNEVAKSAIAKYNVPQKDAEGNEQNLFNRFISSTVGNMKTHFSDSPEKLAALYTELHNQMNAAFGDAVKKFLNEEVAKLPKQDTPEISDEKRTELATQRSKLVNIFKLQQEMLKYYEVTELPSDIEVPNARKGAVGGRGDKITRQYAFYVGDSEENMKHRTVKIDGKKSEVTLGNIASTVAKASFINTKALKDYIIEKLGLEAVDGKIDLGADWTVQLPESSGGKFLRGVELSSANANVDESDDDDDEDDDDEVSEETNETEDEMFS